MNLKDWKKEWSVNNLVFAPEDCDQLPDIAREFLTSYGLPRRLIIDSPLEVDSGVYIYSEISFESISQPLVRYNKAITWGDSYDPELDEALSQEIEIGTIDFGQADASYCVHQFSEAVTQIDIERDPPDVFVNSSVPQLGETLLLAVRWSKANQQAKMKHWKSSLYKLGEAIEAIDAKVFQHQMSFWSGLIKYAIDSKLRSLVIKVAPKKSKRGL